MTTIALYNRTGDIIDYAIVDQDKFETLSKYKWHICQINSKDIFGNVTKCKKYVITHNGNQKTLMHHMVLGKPEKGYVVDHKNNNGLDNRLCNLRKCTPSQNAQNVPKVSSKTSSSYKGVSWETKHKRWVVYLAGKYVGVFHDEKIAAAAYNYASRLKYGDDAYQNDVDVTYIPKEKQVLPKGVRLISNSYHAKIKIQGKVHTIGKYSTPEEAAEAYKEFKVKNASQKVIVENKPITRNHSQIATIEVKYNNNVIECLVDDDDWDLLSKYKWYCDQGYIRSKINGKTVYMHRLITNAPNDKVVDHINGIRHDNRKNNIRVTTYSVNNHNKNKNPLRKVNRKWRGEIIKDGVRYNLSSENYDDAVKRYNSKVKELYGDDARLMMNLLYNQWCILLSK